MTKAKNVRHSMLKMNTKTFKIMKIITGKQFRALILFIWILFGIICFTSCATKTKIEYVDREVVKYQTQYVHDTLINNVHDSVYHTIFQKGDTIYNTKYVQKTQLKDRVIEKIDTCYLDKVQIRVQKDIVEVEKKVTPKWCYYSLVGWIIIIIFAIIKVYKWLR